MKFESTHSLVPNPEATTGLPCEPIAIIGMDCRFPGADGLEAYWNLLQRDEVHITEMPPERRRLTGVEVGEGDHYRYGGFLKDIERFDATLFGISPREAHSIDPQQRLMLEGTWRALESANIPVDRLAGTRTGVFAGVSWNDYIRLQRDFVEQWDGYSGTGSTSLGVVANRVSYLLGLHGPSFSVDTACSSGLVAVHQACRSLACGESDLAIAGGVNVLVSDDYGKILVQAKMLSPTGRCWTFDSRADGYVRSEGCGVVILKRLRDARRDRDKVLAVIRGSAVNQDGRSEGLSAPNGVAQQAMLRAALASAGFPASTIGYVEAHGTGTPLGDPTEVGALKAVMDSEGVEGRLPCWLGAVKSKIGHTEPAAGLAGLIKAVLVLQNRLIPTNARIEKLNPRLDFSNTRLKLPVEPVPWLAPGEHPRRAGVTAYGFGGTNAHVVLEEAPGSDLPPHVVPEGHHHLLTLSARTDASLHALASRYADRIEVADPAALDSICRTANVGRARLPERAAIVGLDGPDMAMALRQLAAGESSTASVMRAWARKSPRVAFLFTGQGSQYLGMGRTLYESEPVFKRHVDLCDEILRPHLGASILEVMFGRDAELLDNTRMAQPALVTVELALVEQWKHWGVRPEFLIGHSIGEAAAAATAGIMDLDTVLRIVAERGRLMASAPGKGTMLSVKAGVGVVAAALAEVWDTIDVAGMNAPDQVVLAGTVEAIDTAQQMLESRKFETTRLKVHNAFHSRLMDPVLPEFRSVFAGVSFREPGLTVIPTGGEPDDNMTSADYWVHQLRCPVRYTEALERAEAMGADTFVEIGPAPVLTGLGKRTLGLEHKVWVSSLRPSQDDRRQMRMALGELVASGVDAALDRLDDHRAVPLTCVPFYAFDRAEYWFTYRAGTRSSPQQGRSRKGTLPLIGSRVDIAIEGVELVCFEAELPGFAETFLLDHQVHKQPIMPAAGYVNMVMAAARKAMVVPPSMPLIARDFKFLRPLPLSAPVRVQTLLQRQAGDEEWSARVVMWNPNAQRWDTCAAGRLTRHAGRTAVDVPTVQGASQDVAAFYARCAEFGLQYGDRFQAVTALQHADLSVHADLSLPDGTPETAPGSLHPVLLDAAFQMLAGLVLGRDAAQRVALPVNIDRLVLHRECPNRLTARGCLSPLPDHSGWHADVVLLDAAGQLIAEVVGLTLLWVDAEQITRSRELPVQAFGIDWIPHSDTGASPAAARAWLVWHQGAHADRSLAEQGLTVIDAGALSDADIGKTSSLLASLTEPAGFIVMLDGDLDAEARDPVDACIALCEQVQRLVLMLQALDLPDGARLWLVTRSAMLVKDEAAPLSLVHAGVAGMLRSVAMEYPALSPSHLDMSRDAAGADWKTAAAVIAAGTETAVAVRCGSASVPRLQARAEAPDARPALRADALYLITGGTGGLGLALAQWLAQAGARHLALVGRKRQPSPEAVQHIQSLHGQGVAVQYLSVDMGDAGEVERMLSTLRKSPEPLRGIFHAAGVLDDRPLADLDLGSWRRVLDAKARSAWLLDQLSGAFELDHFVLYSSVASALGAAGQCNYAAANAMLDALAQQRQQRKVSGLTVNWGAWAEVGMASDPALEAMFVRQGIPPMPPPAALRVLGEAMARAQVQSVVMAVDWQAFGAHRLADHGITDIPSLLRHLVRREAAPTARSLVQLPTTQELSGLATEEAARAILRGLSALVGDVMRIDVQRQFPDEQRLAGVSLPALGVDSLMTMELRTRIRNWVGVDVPAAQLIGGAPLSRLVEMIQQAVPETKPEDAPLPQVVDDIASRHEPFPLTDLQYAYVIGRDAAFAAGRVSAHTYYEFDSPDLDLPRLEQALQRLIERHEMLRAIALPDGRQQILQRVRPYRIKELDLTAASSTDVERELERLRERHSHEVRPVDQWPLFDIRATRLSGGVTRLHVNMDLLFVDVWSYRLMLREWMTLYQAPAASLPPLALSFRDYVLAEQKIETTALYEQSREYWMQRLATIPPAPELPLAIAPEKLGQPVFVRRRATLPAQSWSRLKARGAQAGLTPSIVLLAAFAQVLARWSRSNRFTLDLTLFNRLPLHRHVNDIMGELTSVQLLELDLGGRRSLVETAQQAQQQLWRDLEHRYFNGVRVLRELARARGRSAALMPVVFTSALGQSGENEEDIPVQWLGKTAYGISQTPQVWLDHQVYENHGELAFNWDAIDELYPEGMLDDMFASYCQLLQHLAQDDALWQPGEAVPVPLPLHQAAERARVNSTQADIPARTLHGLFDEQVERTPGAIAVIDSRGMLSYAELSAHAWRLARHLHNAGVQPGELVAVTLEKGWEQVAAVLGILRAGAAYLPVVPELPLARRHLLLAQGQARFVVTQSPFAAQAWPEGMTPITLDGLAEVSAEPLALDVDPVQLAYVIFTSGSTGMPKGVMIDHRGAANTVQDVNRRFEVTGRDRLLMLSALSFDLSVYDIFGALAVGAAIVMPAPDRVVDPAHWSELVERHGVTIWNSVPQLLQIWADYLQAESLQETSPRLALLSGDWIPVRLPDQIRSLCPGLQVVSLGGATEASIWSICYPIGKVDRQWPSIPYGKPLANQTMHVLDEQLEPCPVWTTGEIHIGGIGVALGYRGDEQKTAERFVRHPLTGERLYRTGDLGRYLPGGDIQFLGREDNQVKINGFRIELGEISACLRRQPGVKEAMVAVAVNPITNGRQLVAYLVAETETDPATLAPDVLAAAIAAELPEYMVPPHYVVLDELPLSANGKVDLKALPAPELAAERAAVRTLPRTPTEIRLARIWGGVLHLQNLGIDDHFAALGGDSLQAMRVVSQIRAEFQVELPLIRFYEAPTIGELAQFVDALAWATQQVPNGRPEAEREEGVL